MGHDGSETLRSTLRSALTVAMKERDRIAVPALRSALAALDHAEAVDASHAPATEPGTIAGGVAGIGAGEVPRRLLSDDEARAVVAAVVSERHAAAADYERLNRNDDAERLRAEARVLGAVLRGD